jgi:hypothetical protein
VCEPESMTFETKMNLLHVLPSRHLLMCLVHSRLGAAAFTAQ